MYRTISVLFLSCLVLAGCNQTGERRIKTNGPIVIGRSTVKLVPIRKIEKDQNRLACIDHVKIDLKKPEIQNLDIAYIYNEDNIVICFINKGPVAKHLIFMLKNPKYDIRKMPVQNKIENKIE